MSILQVAALVAIAIVVGRLRGGRELALLGISAVAIFWLQPEEPIRNLQYWLPFATLAIAVLGWAVTSVAEVRSLRLNWPAIAILTGVVLLAGLAKYADVHSGVHISAPSY